MAVYENFARVYDELMDNVPYQQWADCIRSHLLSYGIEGGLVLDLACGTGKMTDRLDRMGYDMIGVDSSVDMLEIARKKTSPECLYLNQDMRNFELYGTVRAVISVCDSINYITDPADLTSVFSLVNNYLDPGGLFLFDVNTDYYYRSLLGEQVIAEDREDVSFIWYNDYEESTCLNTIDLSVFVRENENLYRKYQEIHLQRGYTMQEITTCLRESGLAFLAAYDGYTDSPACEQSRRILFLARETAKAGDIKNSLIKKEEG